MTTLDAPDPATAVDLPRPGGWSIMWRGRRFGESDLTGQHLSTLALISGTDSWESLDVDPRHGHQRLMQMITAFVVVDASRGAVSADEVSAHLAKAIEMVSTAPADEILGALTFDG